jgi:hypothetical protein
MSKLSKNRQPRQRVITIRPDVNNSTQPVSTGNTRLNIQPYDAGKWFKHDLIWSLVATLIVIILLIAAYIFIR